MGIRFPGDGGVGSIIHARSLRRLERTGGGPTGQSQRLTLLSSLQAKPGSEVDLRLWARRVTSLHIERH